MGISLPHSKNLCNLFVRSDIRSEPAGGVVGQRSEAERQARILRYWQAVEYFSPPKVDPVSKDRGVRAVHIGSPLPWEQSLRTKSNYVWRHTVYAGVFDILKVREVLRTVLGDDEEQGDFDARPGGHSAVLCFTVDEAGCLLKDSVTLSTCAWAVGRTIVPGPTADDWLQGFDKRADEILGFLFEYGDGRIPLATAGNSVAQSSLGAVAGVMTRVAVDALTGGLASVAATAGTALAPLVGEIASAAVGSAGQTVGEEAERRARGAVEEGGDPTGCQPAGSAHPSALGSKVLNVDDLAAITRFVAEELQVADALEPNAIRVKSYQIPLRSADDAKGEEFLNSFFVEDLGRIADEVEAGEIGTVLREYLREDSSIDITRRIDLRRRPQEMLHAVAPAIVPEGRWPSKSAHPLTLSQQFAVNNIVLGQEWSPDQGLYAVNGPPGTGKTTMLRDLIAAVVVQRARCLAGLESARHAFQVSPRTWRTEEDANGKTWQMTVFPLVDELTGYEIVVASSNNGAVENISLEIPAEGAVDSDGFPTARYLAEQASAVTGTPAWGAIAARLGRRSYRSEFADRLWWGTGRGTEDQLCGLDVLLRQQIERVRAGEFDPKHGWRDAVNRFNEALAKVERLRLERQYVADALAQVEGPDDELARLSAAATDMRDYQRRVRVHLDALIQEADDARRSHLQAQTRMEHAQQALCDATDHLNRAASAVDAAEHALRTHEGNRPGFLRRWLSRGSTAVWEAGHEPLGLALDSAITAMADAEVNHGDRVAALHVHQRAVEETSSELRAAEDVIERYRAELARIESELASNRDELSRHREARQLAVQCVEAARRRWGDAVPGREWHADVTDREAMERRERSAPWMDSEFATARSELFISALDLHRAVLDAEPDLVRRSLRAVMTVVRGDAPRDLPEATVLAAWQLLFFVVPVVSTTFASMGRMFTGLGKESLGWLFIDEAGQATPHAAVGALWRSRQAVVVGDPRQLEPVLTLPLTGQRRLCRQFEVDAQWAPQGSSVQTIADRLNRFGTWLPEPNGDDETWVGSPLRVHRRCDPLMFEVSNEIAYDGMMVYGVADRQSDSALLTESTWLNVPALSGDAKWNPKEGDYLLATLNLVRERIRTVMLAELSEADGELPEWAADDGGRAAELARRVAESVFVISPFKDVASNDQNLWIPGGRAFPEDDRRSHRILIKTSVGALAGRHARAH
ncbi:DEAD/DEAH box helicase, partial [Nocardia cyriacigeorgica]|uniref:DEAD/DEAH box helicase n=1 Tax=Nocardia cyriacigeorgica TaxID=135487 RepID=UPI001894A593